MMNREIILVSVILIIIGVSFSMPVTGQNLTISQLRATPPTTSAFLNYGQPFSLDKDSLSELQHNYWGEIDTGQYTCDNVKGEVINGYAVKEISNGFSVKNLINCTDEGNITVDYGINDYIATWINYFGKELPVLYVMGNDGVVRMYNLETLTLLRTSDNKIFNNYYDMSYKNKIEYDITNNTGYYIADINTKYLIDKGLVKPDGSDIIVVDDNARQLLDWYIVPGTWDTNNTKIVIKLLQTTKEVGIYSDVDIYTEHPLDIFYNGVIDPLHLKEIPNNYRTVNYINKNSMFRNYAIMNITVNNVYNYSVAYFYVKSNSPLYNYVNGKMSIMLDADKYYNNSNLSGCVYPYELNYVPVKYGSNYTVFVELPNKLCTGNHKLYIFYNSTASNYVSNGYNKFNNGVMEYLNTYIAEFRTSVSNYDKRFDYTIFAYYGGHSDIEQDHIEKYIGFVGYRFYMTKLYSHDKVYMDTNGSSQSINTGSDLYNFIDIIHNTNHNYILNGNTGDFSLYGNRLSDKGVYFGVNCDCGYHGGNEGDPIPDINGNIFVTSANMVYNVSDNINYYQNNIENMSKYLFVKIDNININPSLHKYVSILDNSNCNKTVYLLNDNKIVGYANISNNLGYGNITSSSASSNSLLLKYKCSDNNEIDINSISISKPSTQSYYQQLQHGFGITAYEYNGSTLNNTEIMNNIDLTWNKSIDGFDNLLLKGYFYPKDGQGNYTLKISNVGTNDTVTINGNNTITYNITTNNYKPIPLIINYTDNGDGIGSLKIDIYKDGNYIGTLNSDYTLPDNSNATQKSNIDLDFYIGDMNGDGNLDLVYLSGSEIYIYDMQTLNLEKSVNYMNLISGKLSAQNEIDAYFTWMSIRYTKITGNKIYFGFYSKTERYYDGKDTSYYYGGMVRITFNSDFSTNVDLLGYKSSCETQDHWECDNTNTYCSIGVKFFAFKDKWEMSYSWHKDKISTDSNCHVTSESEEYISGRIGNIGDNGNDAEINNIIFVNDNDFFAFGEAFRKSCSNSNGGCYSSGYSKDDKYYYYVMHNGNDFEYHYSEWNQNGKVSDWWKQHLSSLNIIKDTINNRYIVTGHVLANPDSSGTGIINSLTSVSVFSQITSTIDKLLIGKFSGMNNEYLYVDNKGFNLNDLSNNYIIGNSICNTIIDADMDGKLDLVCNGKLYTLKNANPIISHVTYRQQHNVQVGENVPMVADVEYVNDYKSTIYQNNTYYSTAYLPGIISGSTPVIIGQGQYQTVTSMAKLINKTALFRPYVGSGASSEYQIIYYAKPVTMIKSEQVQNHNYLLYMNFTGSNEVNYFGIIADVPVPETIYYPHLYYKENGQWVDVSNNPQFNFQAIDDNHNGLIDHIKFILPTVEHNQTEMYKLGAIYSNPVICNVTKKVLTNAPITASQYAYWNWTVVCKNTNSFGVNFDSKIKLPLKSSEVMLDKNLTTPESQPNGYFVHILGYLDAGANVTHYITFKTPPITVIPSYFYPTKYYVDKEAEVDLKLDVRNWATEPLPNVHVSIPLVYGENIKVYNSNGTLINTYGQVSGLFDFVIPIIQSQEAQQYIIKYNIPVGTSSYPISQTSTIINGTQYVVEYVKVHSTTPIPLKQNVYLSTNKVPCGKVSKVIDVNSFSSEFGNNLDYTCNGTKTVVNLGSLDVGQDKYIKIYYKGTLPLHKIQSISNATSSIKNALGGFTNNYNNWWKNIFENSLHIQYNTTAKAVAWLTPLVVLGLIIKIALVIPK